jgi:hypothetical protein
MMIARSAPHLGILCYSVAETELEAKAKLSRRLGSCFGVRFRVKASRIEDSSHLLRIAAILISF